MNSCFLKKNELLECNNKLTEDYKHLYGIACQANEANSNLQQQLAAKEAAIQVLQQELALYRGF